MRRLTRIALVLLIAAGTGVAAHRFAPRLLSQLPPLPDFNDVLDVTASAGLRLENLTVAGRDRTNAEDILAAIDVERGAPILSIDLKFAQDAIESLPWVARARVERKLPDTIHVALDERTPFALWQNGGTYVLVDRDGKSITTVAGQYENLPLIVGAGAPAKAAELLSAMSRLPQLAVRARAYVMIGERRWNIHFDSVEEGVAVRLPDDGLSTALDRLAALERDHGILERDIEYVDLRLEDRLIVRPRTRGDGNSETGKAGDAPTNAPSKKKSV